MTTIRDMNLSRDLEIGQVFTTPPGLKEKIAIASQSDPNRAKGSRRVDRISKIVEGDITRPDH